MNGGYKQVPVVSGVTRFDKAPESKVQPSRMTEDVPVLTAFNAGELVPVLCFDVLPNEVYGVTVDEIIRQTTLKVPTMGEMICDLYAFFVPNRIVNTAWKEVMGENTSGSWTANPVSLAPLYTGKGGVSVPVGSVADYYGLPTQDSLPASVLNLMQDLPFRGYLAIYNEYFRDQNYQPPIPFSKANVYEGFLLSVGTTAGVDGSAKAYSIDNEGVALSDGSYPGGTMLRDVYGDGAKASDMTGDMYIPARKTSWSALSAPLKVCKFHDALTSVLPSPQRGPAVTFALADTASVTIPAGSPFNLTKYTFDGDELIRIVGSEDLIATDGMLQTSNGRLITSGVGTGPVEGIQGATGLPLIGEADLSAASSISVDDLRLGFAMQQLWEIYGRNGGRYREVCHALFGVEADDPYSDIPRMLGHVRFPLELYQTAQTSASDPTSPQGTLAGFGYTNHGGFLFHETFLEHGYVHVFVTVRQRNVYPSYLAPHWFRVNNLDFYNPVLANISEQPVLLRTINPFGQDPNKTVFGYQEAWWEYRQHPAVVTGLMRSGAYENVSVWTYQDIFDSSQSSADAAFMESNAKEVLDLTLAYDSEGGPQLKALFTFKFDHQFPGPVYSVPGLDVV